MIFLTTWLGGFGALWFSEDSTAMDVSGVEDIVSNDGLKADAFADSLPPVCTPDDINGSCWPDPVGRPLKLVTAAFMALTFSGEKAVGEV